MNPDVKWTNLSRAEIIDLLGDKGFEISKNTLKKLLKKNDFSAPRKRPYASSWKCCRESADLTHFVSSLGLVVVTQ
jgi:hypothetical protein